MKANIIKNTPIIVFTLFLSSTFGVVANSISTEQVIDDVTYLASDTLKGRANFSSDIDQAADYISKRFSDIGLSPVAGYTSFKQTFLITSIKPESISVTLNGTDTPTRIDTSKVKSRGKIY